MKSNATTGSCPSASFLRQRHEGGLLRGTALTGSGQNIGLLEYYGYDIADLNTYYKNAGQTRTAAVTGISTDGTSLTCLASQGCDDTEQTLDMTQALGMAPGITTLYVYVGSTDTAILGAMSSDTPLPAQLSSSWTWSPADPSTDDPYFEKMAAQGQSFFQAAGDSGKWTTSNYPYPAEDAQRHLRRRHGLNDQQRGRPMEFGNRLGRRWRRDFPGSHCDSLLAAAPGRDQLDQQGIHDLSERPGRLGKREFYLLRLCRPNHLHGQRIWRDQFCRAHVGRLPGSGQSTGAANGDAALGFINPTIYPIGVSSSYDTDFHDITSGSNGFPAVTGYDLATGWGSPNGADLINALTGTSTSPNFTISASPTSVSVVQGSSGTSTITTAVSGGFDSAITLSASGQPTGVTVGFSPTSITGSGSSTMTLTVASNTATGTYPITVTGTGGRRLTRPRSL